MHHLAFHRDIRMWLMVSITSVTDYEVSGDSLFCYMDGFPNKLSLEF